MKELLILINEELNGILNEREYSDEDIVETRDIDFQREYDKLNQQLFDNKLPKVPLKWSNTKRALGHVRSLHNRYTGEQRIEFLALSGFFKTPYKLFKNVLAHEMIHVEQISVFKERGNHGWSFMKEADRINGMGLGYKISEVNTERVGMSDQAMAKAGAKTMIALIFNINGKYHLSVTTPKVYHSDSDYLFNFLERLVNRGKYNSIELTVVESTNPELAGNRIARNLKGGFSYTPLSDEFLEQLLEGNIIKNIKIKRGAPMEISEENLPSSSFGEWEVEDIV